MKNLRFGSPAILKLSVIAALSFQVACEKPTVEGPFHKYTIDVSNDEKWQSVINLEFCTVSEIDAFKYKDDPVTVRLSGNMKTLGGTIPQFVLPIGTRLKIIRIQEYHNPSMGIYLQPIVQFKYFGHYYQANAEWLFDRGWGHDYLRPLTKNINRC